MLLRRGLLWKRLVLAHVMLPVSTVSGFFPFQMTKRNQATAGPSQVANVLFVQDGFSPLALQKLSRGTGGRGPWLGTAGRACKVSIGERAVQEQAPLVMQRKGRDFSVTQVARPLPACVFGAMLFLWCVLCRRPSSGL